MGSDDKWILDQTKLYEKGVIVNLKPIFTELSPPKSLLLLIYLNPVGIMVCDVKGANE